LEVQYMWSQKFRLSTLLYICCRYGLVANVIYFLAIAGKMNISCDVGYKISSSLSILGRVAVFAVWTVRSWIIYKKSRLVLGFLTTLSLAGTIFDIMHVPVLLCHGNSKRFLFSLIMGTLMAIFEVCAVGVTTLRCVQAIRVTGPIRKQTTSLMFLLLKQGILYFFGVTLLTIASLIIALLIPGGFLRRLLSAVTLPLSGLMTARFLLHLRKWDKKSSTAGLQSMDERSPPLTFAPLRTQSYIDDFGEDPVYVAEQTQELERPATACKENDRGGCPA